MLNYLKIFHLATLILNKINCLFKFFKFLLYNKLIMNIFVEKLKSLSKRGETDSKNL